MGMRAHPRLRAALLAVAGLLLAAALGAATSRITSQHVGLSGESPSVGKELIAGTSPRHSRTARKRRLARERRQARREAQRQAAADVDDDSGGEHEHQHHSDDDGDDDADD